MIGLFLNPGFLLIAAALVSVPIIIHLINRMRFKRIRWAAMEFLLKAQKRTRRRLIIEQMLLLALRCLLIALVGLLVSRFIGCGDANLAGKPNLHIALLDDTPSMQDQWIQDGVKKNCFEVAKNEILIKKIAKGLSLSKTSDRLIIVPLSQLTDPDFKGESFERLNDPDKLKACNQYIGELQPSMVHVNMLQAVKRAQAIMADYPESQLTLHILSDFRHDDWSTSKADALLKEVSGMVQVQKGIKIRPIDTVYPARSAGQANPDARDNVGILDLRPSTRIIGTNMPVQFTVTLKNFSGKQAEFHLEARNENTGKDMQDVDFNPQNPIKMLPGATSTVTFEKRFIPDKANEPYFAHVSVRLVDALKHELGNDGLLADNLRHAVVEVRDKVPILVVDGDGPKGRDESKDSFFIHVALTSVPGSSYQMVYGDELAPGNATNPTKALERADLNKFPTIFMLNVRDLTPKQTANLENYVKEGGGVAFFMGPNVNPAWYNKNLYKEGKGIFPAPIRDDFYPGRLEKELEPKGSDTYQLIIRDEKFAGTGKTPIFGMMFVDPKLREPLRNLPIRRYFKVAEGRWKPDPGRVFELATLPNDALAVDSGNEVASLTRQPATNVKAIMANKELAKYQASLQKHLDKIETLVRAGSEAKAYHLANQIDFLLNDKGGSGPNAPASMTEFWANSDPDVQTLRRDLQSLRDRVNYGDPFVITETFGKGKVVAVMSTAGKDWNDWGGGSLSMALYQPFIWEMQNYLSSQGSEANLTVGSDINLQLDAEQFKGARLKLVRTFMKPKEGAPAVEVKIGEPESQEHDGQLHFKMTKNMEPGVYISRLVDDNAPDKALAILAHAFNVDTEREGDLTRVGSDELERELIEKSNGAIKFGNVNTADTELVGRVNDFSESPWLFLLFLFVLVAEQALAVHLSFHMKASDDQLAPAGTGGKATSV
jgi:hypothetical protein